MVQLVLMVPQVIMEDQDYQEQVEQAVQQVHQVIMVLQEPVLYQIQVDLVVHQVLVEMQV